MTVRIVYTPSLLLGVVEIPGSICMVRDGPELRDSDAASMYMPVVPAASAMRIGVLDSRDRETRNMHGRPRRGRGPGSTQ